MKIGRPVIPKMASFSSASFSYACIVYVVFVFVFVFAFAFDSSVFVSMVAASIGISSTWSTKFFVALIILSTLVSVDLFRKNDNIVNEMCVVSVCVVISSSSLFVVAVTVVRQMINVTIELRILWLLHSHKLMTNRTWRMNEQQYQQ